MISEDRIQQTVQAGQKNKETAELVRNWCAHAQIKRFGGVGLIEEMYNVPIGHMGLECPHAPAGGSFCWDLADAAIQFYDSNCITCTKRKPVGLPNLSKLIADRDARRDAQKLENERQDQEQADALARRDVQRAEVRVSLDPVAGTNLDLLSELDRDGKNATGDKLVEVAGLAPESFPPPLVDYLFAVLDQRIVGMIETALRVLSRLPSIDKRRLANAALDALAKHGGGSCAPEIIEENAAHASPDRIGPAMPVLISIATRAHGPFAHGKPLVQQPLLELYRHWPEAVKSGLRSIIGNTEARGVGLGARGLRMLIDHDPKLAGFMTEDLLAKLARAKWLVKGDDHGIGETLHDIREVLRAAFLSAPETVDIAIQQWLPGASPEGVNELHKVYGLVLRRARRPEDDEPLTQAHQIAFSRLVTAAGKYGLDDEDNRFTATTDIMHGDPYELTPVVTAEIDNLLGSAAILYVKLDEALAKPRDPNDPMTFWSRMGLRQRLGHTAEVFIRWACNAAGKSGPDAIRKVLSFLDGLPEGSERLRGEVVGNFHELAETTEGLKLCLPQYYSALVGPSQLVRSHAATALGEMSRQALENMPPLVFEAFLALMRDSYNIVHQAAVRALERFSLPKELDGEARRALSDIILCYSKLTEHQRFLVTAIEVYTYRYAPRDRLAGSLGDNLLNILTQIEPKILMQEGRHGLPILMDNPNYMKLFIRLLSDPEIGEHDVEHLVDELERHPPKQRYEAREKIAAAGVRLATHWLYEVPSIVEALTECGAWAEAAQMLRQILDGIEDNMHFKTRRLNVQLYRIACDVETVLAEGRPEKLGALMTEWSATLAEEEKVHAEIRQKATPPESVLGSP